jgi:hypothetical protein
VSEEDAWAVGIMGPGVRGNTNLENTPSFSAPTTLSSPRSQYKRDIPTPHQESYPIPNKMCDIPDRTYHKGSSALYQTY